MYNLRGVSVQSPVLVFLMNSDSHMFTTTDGVMNIVLLGYFFNPSLDDTYFGLPDGKNRVLNWMVCIFCNSGRVHPKGISE